MDLAAEWRAPPSAARGHLGLQEAATALWCGIILLHFSASVCCCITLLQRAAATCCCGTLLLQQHPAEACCRRNMLMHPAWAHAISRTGGHPRSPPPQPISDDAAPPASLPPPASASAPARRGRHRCSALPREGPRKGGADGLEPGRTSGAGVRSRGGARCTDPEYGGRGSCAGRGVAGRPDAPCVPADRPTNTCRAAADC